MATIKEVAAAAGVSVATVSRYFNAPDQLSPAARDAVASAVASLGYHPSALGRNLRISRTRKILAVLPAISNPFYSRVLTGMSEAAEANGYTVLACTTGGDPSREKRLIQMLYDRFVDGAVFFSTTLSRRAFDALAKEYPVVQCCEYLEGAFAGGVSIDNEQAAYEAVSHLIQLGHTRIGLVNSDNQFESTILRERGYRKALARHGLPVCQEYIRRGTYGFKNGEESLNWFLSLTQPPTGIFAVADSIAIGVVRAAAGRDIRVGKSFSVIGFDDTSLAKNYQPGITSVAQPRQELGETAVKLLLKRMKSLKQPGELVFLPHRLMIRESTDG